MVHWYLNSGDVSVFFKDSTEFDFSNIRRELPYFNCVWIDDFFLTFFFFLGLKLCHLLSKVKCFLWGKTSFGAFFILVGNFDSFIVCLKLGLKFLNSSSSNIVSSLIQSSLLHFLSEVHLLYNNFIKRMPDILSLHSSDGVVGFQVFKRVTNSKWFLFLAFIKFLGDGLLVSVALCGDGFLNSVGVSELDSLDYDLVFR